MALLPIGFRWGNLTPQVYKGDMKLVVLWMFPNLTSENPFINILAHNKHGSVIVSIYDTVLLSHAMNWRMGMVIHFCKFRVVLYSPGFKITRHKKRIVLYADNWKTTGLVANTERDLKFFNPPKKDVRVRVVF
ncbi:hypothetical protein RCL1_003051 [Eukaryota sp. TZLM3-RCL]